MGNLNINLARTGVGDLRMTNSNGLRIEVMER